MTQPKHSEVLTTFSNLEHAKRLLCEVQRIGIVNIPKSVITNIDKGLKLVRPMIKFVEK